MFDDMMERLRGGEPNHDLLYEVLRRGDFTSALQAHRWLIEVYGINLDLSFVAEAFVEAQQARGSRPPVLKAIETIYRGHRFRSRTEARWAVFMDSLGIQWRYEHEGYDLDGVWYLPDFWLPEHRFFFEVKGEEPDREDTEKARLLSQASRLPVYVAFGRIGVPDVPFDPYSRSALAFLPPDGDQDDSYWWCECPTCGYIGIEYEGRAGRLPCDCPKSTTKIRNYSTPRLMAAYEAATLERFERVA